MPDPVTSADIAETVNTLNDIILLFATIVAHVDFP